MHAVTVFFVSVLAVLAVAALVVGHSYLKLRDRKVSRIRRLYERHR